MASIDLDPSPAMPRDERKDLVDIQLAAIKTFTENPKCNNGDLETISIHLAVLMAKISTRPAPEPSATAKPPNRRASNNKVKNWSYRQSSATKTNGPQTKRGSQPHKTVLSIANGGLSPHVETVRKERKKKVKAPRLTKDEAATLGLFSNLSLRIKGKENMAAGGTKSVELDKKEARNLGLQ
ncbi:hypothetical protein DL98DRAFT_534231 [Cadophora sp. DSE1049]|nr:hypothetical protein DL98DRAFT_534231 [Cadophora sp. DSE1049]